MSTKEEILDTVAEVLSVLSSYSKKRIIELVQYSDDTNLQLIALLSADNKDVLATDIVRKYPFLNQTTLENALFNEVKTVEKLIDYIYGKQD